MRVAALFAGIGGIERGLSAAGSFEIEYACEWWDPARRVLAHQFPGVPIGGDILDVDRLPPADMVTGGFPCTDLSQAGRMAGIEGTQSGLVRKMLQLVEHHSAKWLLLENVKNMLPLHGGRAMKSVTDELSEMGFRWAYRLVDSRFTGVPQRRQRVIILASRTDDPRPVLFADDSGPRGEDTLRDDASGFYWTEGLRGLGWCRDGVPTLKGGSTIGIPSPPAIWIPSAAPGFKFVTPGIEVAERLQGFPGGWTTRGATGNRGEGARWKLIGNAVTVGVAEWVGRGIIDPGEFDASLSTVLSGGDRWPDSAWGERGKAWKFETSKWPELQPYRHLRDLLGDDFRPLSHRASAGFLERLQRSSLRSTEEFRLDLAEHVEFARLAA